MYTRPLIWGLKVLLAVRTIMFVMNTSNQIVGGPDDILVYYQGETSVPSFPHHQTESQSTMLSSHCQYRDFPQETHPGLPHLFDVFADHTKEHAIFLGAHRKETIPGGPYDESDSLFTSDPKGNRMYHFLCRFQGAINVLSEAVHSPGIGGGHPFSKKRNFIIRCRIPPELRNLVVQGQRETMLHVDLVALDDPTANYTQIEVSQLLSSSSSDLPAVSQIPVCFPTSNSDRPSTTTTTPLQPKSFQLVGFTQIRSEYMTIKGETVSEAFRIHEWIHFHHYQGVEHFIVYDNDIHDHGPLEQELQPYVERGLVTRIWNPSNETRPPTTAGRKKPRPGMYGRVMQSSMENAALWRYGFITEYFLACDIDEFFLPMNSTKRVVEIVKEEFSAKPATEVLYWRPYVVTYCNGTVLPPELVETAGPTSNNEPFEHSPMATKKCRTNSRISGSKLILKADQVWLFHTHDAFLNSRGSKPVGNTIPLSTGYLAHYRRGSFQTRSLPDGNVTILTNDEAKDPSMSNLDMYLQSRAAERIKR
jgi:Glycosyltransferase family 92